MQEGVSCRRSLRPRAHALVVLGFAAWLAARLWAFWPARDPVGAERYADTAEYLRVAHGAIFSMRFFTEHKPFGYPLFLDAMPSLPAVPFVQFALSTAAWAFLAAVVARRTAHPWGRACAGGAILSLALAAPVAQWDSLLLTESLSLSLFVVLAASLMLVHEKASAARVASACLAGLALASLRDTNAFCFALLALPVAALVVRRSVRAAVALVVAAALAVALVAASSSVRRWQILTADQIGKRALLDPQMRDYFVARGMPVRPDLSSVIFEDTRRPLPAQTLMHDERLARFVPWFERSGRRTYETYLVTHPRASIARPVQEMPTILDSVGVGTYRSSRFSPLPLVGAAYVDGGATALLWLGVLSLVALPLVAAGVSAASLVLPLVLGAWSVPMSVLVWDGEPSEIPRHALLVAVGVRVGVVLLAVAVGQALVELSRAGEGNRMPVVERPG